MEQLVAEFPQQIREALNIGKQAKLTSWSESIRNVLICGLGGSGIGGAIVSTLVLDEISVPVVVNNTYSIPAWVNEETLVIVSSYSGNTEETLQALEEALAKHAEIACVTGGGSVLTVSKEKALNCIEIPGGNPPRSMLAYSLTQLFFILKHYALIKSDFGKDLEEAAALLEKEAVSIKAEAQEVANFIHGKLPVIYSDDRLAPIATRFRQQLNENSKMLGWSSAFPEMNHNELVGWAGGNDSLAVVMLRSDKDYSRTQVRMDISKDVFSKHTPHVREIHAKGNSRIAQALYHVHLEDWVTVMLADLKQIDAVEVDVISHLKAELGKI